MLVGVRGQLRSWFSPSTVSSRQLPLWVLGLSSLLSLLSHVTGPLLDSLYPFFDVVFIKFMCRNCLHFAYEIVIWEDKLAQGLAGHFQVPELLLRLLCMLSYYGLLMFAVTDIALREGSIFLLGIWAIKMMIDPVTLPFYLVEVFKTPEALKCTNWFYLKFFV